VCSPAGGLSPSVKAYFGPFTSSICPEFNSLFQGTSTGHDPRTDHLRPVIAFLLAQGNRLAQWWHEDGWRSDPGGELHYASTDPIDAARLRAHFDFPPSIVLDEIGGIRDRVNRVSIYYDQPVKPLCFDLTEPMA
jgi:hypothetical protein